MADSAEDRATDAAAQDGAIKRRLTELGQRLDATRTQREAQTNRPTRRATAMAMAIRAVSEIVAAVLVGATIGWGVDWWLGTSPVFLLIFFLFGFAAGVVNVVRATRQMKPEAADPKDN